MWKTESKSVNSLSPLNNCTEAITTVGCGNTDEKLSAFCPDYKW